MDFKEETNREEEACRVSAGGMPQEPAPCPRCGSKMRQVETHGTFKSFPMVGLACSNDQCLWNLQVAYDEMDGKDSGEVMAKLIRHYNEGVLKQT